MGLSLLIENLIKGRERRQPLSKFSLKSSLWLLPSIAISSDRAFNIINIEQGASRGISIDKEISMRYYQCKHPFVCGVDIHSKMIYLCIIDKNKNILLHRPVKNKDTATLTNILLPYKDKIVVSAESCFPYYWLADFCKELGIEFQLGHALYMKHIHGGKAKNDRIDSEKIAMLTINQMLPEAYVYPKEKRHLRDLLRRRLYFVRKRAEIKAHVQIQAYQANIQETGRISPARIQEKTIAPKFENIDQRVSVEMNLSTVDFYDNKISELENYIANRVNSINRTDVTLLQTIRGIGDIISMTILLEMDDIHRFKNHKEFASYARLIKCSHESAGKKLGFGGSKIGNPYLKYIFGEASVLLPQFNPEIKKYLARLESKYGKMKSRAILAHKIGRTVYYMLKNRKVFDLKKFLSS